MDLSVYSKIQSEEIVGIYLVTTELGCCLSGYKCDQALQVSWPLMLTNTYFNNRHLHLVTRGKGSWIKYTNPGIPGYKCDQGAQVSRPLKLINTSLLTSRLSFLDVFLPLWLSSDPSHRGEGQLLPEEGTKSVWT